MHSELRMSQGLLYKACAALWRDVKYAVMARNYQLVKELSAALLRAQSYPDELQRWLLEVKRIELKPVTESALRNTVYHLLGYWKRNLTAQERQGMADLTAKDPYQALDMLREKLPELGNPYLQSSYVWRQEPWDKAEFRTRGKCYQFRLNAAEALSDMDPAKIKISVSECGEAR